MKTLGKWLLFSGGLCSCIVIWFLIYTQNLALAMAAILTASCHFNLYWRACQPPKARVLVFMQHGLIQQLRADAPVTVVVEDRVDGELMVERYECSADPDPIASGFNSAWQSANEDAIPMTTFK